jgi:hypothetical protein
MAIDRICRAELEWVDALVFSTDASELGWAPGYFPKSVETDLGNHRNLILIDLDENRARYAQDAGCIEVKVYND